MHQWALTCAWFVPVVNLEVRVDPEDARQASAPEFVERLLGSWE